MDQMQQENKLQLNAALSIPYSSREEFYEMWLSFMRPIHKMPLAPTKVFAVLLAEREKYAVDNNDDAIIDTILFSEEVQNEVCRKLNIDKSRMWNNLSRLRKYGVIKKNRVNVKYLPDLNGDVFRVLIQFYSANKKQ